MQYLPHLYWILPAAFACYLLLVPLLILATFSHDADPVVEHVDDDMPLPDDVDQHFFEVEDCLESLGFEIGEMMYLPRQTDNVRVIMQLFIHHKDRTSAMGATMFTLVNGLWSVSNQYVEFTTRHHNGFTVNTSNSSEIGAFPSSETTITSWLSCLDDIPQLYSAHCAMSEFHVPHESRVLRVESEFNGNAAAYLADCMKEEFQHAEEIGYLRLTPDASTYRATFIGAYKMTWQQIPPFKGMIRTRMTRQALKRLTTAGWDVNSPVV